MGKHGSTICDDLGNGVLHVVIYIYTGWWFGTFFIFPHIGNNHPNWLIFFRLVQTTNQYIYTYTYMYMTAQFSIAVFVYWRVLRALQISNYFLGMSNSHPISQLTQRWSPTLRLQAGSKSHENGSFSQQIIFFGTTSTGYGLLPNKPYRLVSFCSIPNSTLWTTWNIIMPVVLQLVLIRDIPSTYGAL